MCYNTVTVEEVLSRNKRKKIVNKGFSKCFMISDSDDELLLGFKEALGVGYNNTMHIKHFIVTMNKEIMHIT